MAVRSHLPVVVLLPLFFSAATTAVSGENATTLSAYDVLQSFNFPIGLLPQGVIGYDLDPVTGKFAAYSDVTCKFSLEGSYDLQYKSTISGYIYKNRLSNLQGVTVKIFLLWINIVEVTRVDEELRFSVGIASADFPISNFDVCPQCGCGIDCLSLPGGEERGSRIKLKTGF